MFYSFRLGGFFKRHAALCAFTLMLLGIGNLAHSARANGAPLPANKAFQLSMIPVPSPEDPAALVLSWQIAPGYILYQNSLVVSVDQDAHVPLEALVHPLPPGSTKVDPSTGTPMVVYSDHLEVTLPVNAAHSTVEVRYQGCSGGGLCYPPITQTWHRTPPPKGAATTLIAPSDAPAAPPPHVLYSFLKQVMLFFGFGLLLAFTPCVLPMIPILAEIILGHGRQSFKRSCVLASTYLVTMAFCYALMGYATAKLGIHFNTILQEPRFLIALIVVIFLLAFMQLDWIRFQWSIPQSIKSLFSRKKTHHKQPKTSPGTVFGAMGLGLLSALVLSPCVTPALVGSLLYISQSAHPLWGSLTLFALGLGMGTPLALATCFGSRFLPKTGAWMVRIKHFTGLLLLLLGIVLITRLGLFKSQEPVQQVQSVAEWQTVLAKTPPSDVLLLEAYADWCINCQIMERTLFKNDDINAQLAAQHVHVWRLDLTSPSPETDELKSHLNLLGPPTYVFFQNGRELKHKRIIGYLSPARFSDHIKKIDD